MYKKIVFGNMKSVFIILLVMSQLIAVVNNNKEEDRQLDSYHLPFITDTSSTYDSNNHCMMITTSVLGRVDPNSFSNPDEIAVTDIALFLDVDFESRTLKGRAEVKCDRKISCAANLILDAKDLNISSIVLKGTNETFNFTVGGSYKTFGSPLDITIPSTVTDKTFTVVIFYETSPTASGLQWLTAEQTLGKKEPFMFSQCQAIHARSIVPCQDTPSAKIRYTAEITAPKQLTVLMSALHVGSPTAIDSNKNLSKFEQPVSIPTYLIAFAVGRLDNKRVGPRCRVWAEPEALDKSAYEFAETEQVLEAAVSIAGDYVWGVYDLLVMPPSFPFGGMENPCITFVTPTVLAGDRSLVDVVAHEISHSWSGNLVTTATFEHFWLNEGFTMFLERKITGKLHGSAVRHFEATQGLATLKDTVEKTLGVDNPFTKLVPNLTDVDPDDAFSTVPYEKGHSFLFYLESLVGEDPINKFLKDYFNNFKHQSITTNDFKNYFTSYFRNCTKISEIDWDAWLYSSGMPIVIPQYDSTLTDACAQVANTWLQQGAGARTSADTQSLSSNQMILFLERLLQAQPLSPETIQSMEEAYKLNSNRNSEIRFRWIRLGLHAHMEEFVEKALEFINEQGRMKYVRPVYRDLYDWQEKRQIAIDNYHKNKKSMMFVLSHQLLKDLHIQ